MVEEERLKYGGFELEVDFIATNAFLIRDYRTYNKQNQFMKQLIWNKLVWVGLENTFLT